jgi:hypothetical protein
VEITGWDRVVFTFTPPRKVFARVLASVLERWPAALVEGLGEPGTRTEPLTGVRAERLPSRDGHLIFYRDAAMVRHMAEEAYVPMTDGDGPFAVITRVREDVEFEVSGLDELHAADHQPQGPRPPDPYQAWFCSPQVIEVTAVTPGDIAAHPFSAWVLAEVKRACRQPVEPSASADVGDITALQSQRPHGPQPC